MRFYADENFPLPVVAELRGLGHDVLTVFEDGRANQKIGDEKVLNRSRRLGRVLLTINRLDFKRLHQRDINTRESFCVLSISILFDKPIGFTSRAGMRPTFPTS